MIRRAQLILTTALLKQLNAKPGNKARDSVSLAKVNVVADPDLEMTVNALVLTNLTQFVIPKALSIQTIAPLKLLNVRPEKLVKLSASLREENARMNNLMSARANVRWITRLSVILRELHIPITAALKLLYVEPGSKEKASVQSVEENVKVINQVMIVKRVVHENTFLSVIMKERHIPIIVHLKLLNVRQGKMAKHSVLQAKVNVGRNPKMTVIENARLIILLSVIQMVKLIPIIAALRSPCVEQGKQAKA